MSGYFFSDMLDPMTDVGDSATGSVDHMFTGTLGMISDVFRSMAAGQPEADR